MLVNINASFHIQDKGYYTVKLERIFDDCETCEGQAVVYDRENDGEEKRCPNCTGGKIDTGFSKLIPEGPFKLVGYTTDVCPGKPLAVNYILDNGKSFFGAMLDTPIDEIGLQNSVFSNKERAEEFCNAIGEIPSPIGTFPFGSPMCNGFFPF